MSHDETQTRLLVYDFMSHYLLFLNYELYSLSFFEVANILLWLYYVTFTKLATCEVLTLMHHCLRIILSLDIINVCFQSTVQPILAMLNLAAKNWYLI